MNRARSINHHRRAIGVVLGTWSVAGRIQMARENHEFIGEFPSTNLRNYVHGLDAGLASRDPNWKREFLGVNRIDSGDPKRLDYPGCRTCGRGSSGQTPARRLRSLR